MLTGIGRKAQAFWRSRKRNRGQIDPSDDIQRESLDGSGPDQETEISRMGGLQGDIRKNWVMGLGRSSLRHTFKPMSLNLLLLYEIKEKAARVTSRKTLREFEKWVTNLLATCKDAAVERAANIQLFRLRDEFAGGLA